MNQQSTEQVEAAVVLSEEAKQSLERCSATLKVLQRFHPLPQASRWLLGTIAVIAVLLALVTFLSTGDGFLAISVEVALLTASFHFFRSDQDVYSAAYKFANQLPARKKEALIADLRSLRETIDRPYYKWSLFGENPTWLLSAALVGVVLGVLGKLGTPDDMNKATTAMLSHVPLLGEQLKDMATTLFTQYSALTQGLPTASFLVGTMTLLVWDGEVRRRRQREYHMAMLDALLEPLDSSEPGSKAAEGTSQTR